MKRFFSFDPEGDFELHDTAEQAQAAAQSSLDQYRDEAPDGWNENVDRVCWGEIREQVVETMRRPYDPKQDFFMDPECECVVDYGLVAASATETTQA